VARLQLQAAAYWTSAFQVSRADIEYLFSHFLETETPFTSRDLALRLIEYRISQEEEKFRKQVARGEVFQPKGAYKVGQELVFPVLDFSIGKIVAERAGQNPEYGDFTVIEVEFENQQRREFASMLQAPHALNIDEAGGQTLNETPALDAQAIFDQYSETIIDELEAKLVDQEDAIYFAGKWFLRSLLPSVSVGHLHLAEAILDINGGGPSATAEILKELDMAKEAPNELREFGLGVAMSNDERFDDVGPAGQVQWYLRQLEPQEVSKTPPRLVYQTLDYDRKALNQELLALERELDDEWSPFEPPVTPIKEAKLSLIYPHRRVGTLPLTSQVESLFPTAFESQRIRVTLVDNQDQSEFAGWVVRDGKYVYGLDDFYRRHKLPIGAQVIIRTTDDPARLVLDFEAYRPRSEYIRLAVPQNGKLTFSNHKRSIGAGYDELLILGAEDLEGVDAVWNAVRERRRGLVEIMRDLIPELARLNPQNAVHAKTLYSAVNVVRRCPPGPIFAALASRSEFQHVGGPYWRLSS
jgi:hypothetical protein